MDRIITSTFNQHFRVEGVVPHPGTPTVSTDHWSDADCDGWAAARIPAAAGVLKATVQGRDHNLRRVLTVVIVGTGDDRAARAAIVAMRRAGGT